MNLVLRMLRCRCIIAGCIVPRLPALYFNSMGSALAPLIGDCKYVDCVTLAVSDLHVRLLMYSTRE